MVFAASPAVGSTIASGAAGSGWLSSLGSFLGGSGILEGLGGAIGGLFGGDDKPKFQTVLNDQMTAMRKLIPLELGTKINAFRENGIHPLYGLGVPFNSSWDAAIGDRGSSGPDFQSMGQNLGRAAHALASKEERGIARISAQLGLERGHLENELLKSQIAQINSSMNPPLSMNNKGEIIPGQVARYATKYGPLNVDKNINSARRHSYLYQADGSVIPILNPDAGDNEFLMGWDFLTHTLPAELKNTWNRSWKPFRDAWNSIPNRKTKGR